MAELNLEDSILLSIKKLIGGLDEEDTSFDMDLIVFINSTFTVLAQVGVGPDEPFRISGKASRWTDFEYDDLEAVKEYMFLKVKMTFDPPLNGSIMEAYRQRANELEWRLNVFSEELHDEE